MFSIIRTKKIAFSKVKGASEHNLRKRKEKNVDETRSHLNEVLIDTFNVSQSTDKTLSSELNKYYEEVKATQKKGSIALMEFVLTASPEFFKTADEETFEQWKKSQIEFAKTKWGDSVKLAVLHMDETSPHIHILISTEHTTTKKYKNQFGEFHKETTSLNVKRFDREYLKQLQTDYAEHNKEFGLKRGLYNSNATHRTLKEFANQLEQAEKKDYTNTINQRYSKLIKNMFGFVSVKQLEEKLTPMINTLLKQNKLYKTFMKNYKKNVEIINNYLEEKKEFDKEKVDFLEKQKEIDKKNKKEQEKINQFKLEYEKALKKISNEKTEIKKSLIELNEEKNRNKKIFTIYNYLEKHPESNFNDLVKTYEKMEEEERIKKIAEKKKSSLRL